MFAGLENVQANPRRGWIALVSFTLQAAAVAAALAIPLMYPNSLPDLLAHRPIFVPVSSPVISDTARPPHPGATQAGPMLPARPISVTQEHALRFPTGNNNQADLTDEPISFVDLGVGILGPAGPNLGNGAVNVHPTLAPPTRVSRAMQSYLIRRIEPTYPPIAKSAGVQGEVLIKAIISTEGKIEQAQVISGSPWLSRAALDANRQWHYRPYLLNDKPVEVETEITVNFYLTR
jgi:periplasmic protein TonB